MDDALGTARGTGGVHEEGVVIRPDLRQRATRIRGPADPFARPDHRRPRLRFRQSIGEQARLRRADESETRLAMTDGVAHRSGPGGEIQGRSAKTAIECAEKAGHPGPPVRQAERDTFPLRHAKARKPRRNLRRLFSKRGPGQRGPFICEEVGNRVRRLRRAPVEPVADRSGGGLHQRPASAQ